MEIEKETQQQCVIYLLQRMQNCGNTSGSMREIVGSNP